MPGPAWRDGLIGGLASCGRCGPVARAPAPVVPGGEPSASEPEKQPVSQALRGRGSGHQGQQPFLPDQQHRDELMQAKEEIAGGTKNKAALQNAAAAKKILTKDRGSVWAEIDSDVEELDCT